MKDSKEIERRLIIQAHQALDQVAPEDRAEILGLSARLRVSVAWVLRRAISEYAIKIRKGSS
jgi:hypothetical protein